VFRLSGKFLGITALVVLLISACVSTQVNLESARKPAFYGHEGKAIEKLTFDKTVQALGAANVRTVEDALKVLSEKYAPYMKFHTLMYESLSLHEASYAEPRALVFGPDAEFILSFNGNIKQRGGLAIETMEFDESSGNFLFREIAFKNSAAPEKDTTLKESEIAFDTELFRVSKPNPQKCTACHGQNTRPIWETYFIWPGAYGSNDDNLLATTDPQTAGTGNFSALLREGIKPGASQGRLLICVMDLPIESPMSLKIF
jgi:hypothetical protein